METKKEIFDEMLDSTVRESIANIIVDLYEMRASTLPRPLSNKTEKIDNLFQYNFFSTAISVLCDKYKIKNHNIEEIIRKRAFVDKLESRIDKKK